MPASSGRWLRSSVMGADYSSATQSPSTQLSRPPSPSHRSRPTVARSAPPPRSQAPSWPSPTRATRAAIHQPPSATQKTPRKQIPIRKSCRTAPIRPTPDQLEWAPCPNPPDSMTPAAKFEIEYLQYLGPDGKPVGELPEAFRDPKQLVPLFKQMLFVRTFDSKSIKLQRTGKLGTYAASLGHEAAHVGIGASMREDDVFAPSYREYGAQFMRGVKPREVLLYWGGDERGNDFEGPRGDYPWCVPISTQCLMA